MSDPESIQQVSERAFQRRCGHPDWQQCECDRPIRNAHAETITALNTLANELKAQCQKFPHQSTCPVSEIGWCGCAVHGAFKVLDEKYRALADAIQRTYTEAVM